MLILSDRIHSKKMLKHPQINSLLLRMFRCFTTSVYHTDINRFSTTTTRSLIHQASTAGRCLASYGSVGVLCLSQENNDALHCLGTATRFGTLAVANLRSYLQSCTDAILGILAFSVFSNSTTTQYAHWEYQSSNLAITILCCNRLSYAASSM